VTNQEVIDPSALATLAETTGDDPEFLAELIDTYLTDAVDLLDKSEAASAAGDAAELRRAAHSLKSNSATFGAIALTALAKNLEELGKAGELDETSSLIAQAREEFAHVERSLRETQATL
jgi:HPt (histidine-containing phosphotransfer) domain-containing protein